MVRKDATGEAARMIADFERIELERLQRGRIAKGQTSEPERAERDRSARVMAPRDRANRDRTGPLKVLSDWSATQWILGSAILAYCKDTFDNVWALLLRSTSTGILRLEAVYNKITAQEFLCSWYGTRWVLEPVLASCNSASEFVLASVSKRISNGLLILEKLCNRATVVKVSHDFFETRKSLTPILAYCSGAWQIILKQINTLLGVLKKGFAAVPGPVVWGSMGLIVTGIFITELDRNRAAREQALREQIERERAEREMVARQEMQSFVTWLAVLSILAIIGAGIFFYQISVYNNKKRDEQVQTFNYTLNRNADRVVRAIESHEEVIDRMSGAVNNVGRAKAYHGKAVDNMGREVKYLGAAANRYTEQTTEYRSQRQKLLEAPPVESRTDKWDRREKKVRIATSVGKLIVGGITGIQIGS